jgi:5-methylcytosine-specific restriction endonuclease McrA
VKTCTKCSACKSLSEFSRRAASQDGYQPMCKVCVTAYKAAHYKKNRKKINAICAENYQKSREAHDARTSEWRAKHPERTRELARRWNATRRARKLANDSEPYTEAEVIELWGSDCVYCAEPYEHIDHVIPIARGGPDALHNVVPACARCNLSKGAKLLSEWGGEYHPIREYTQHCA